MFVSLSGTDHPRVILNRLLCVLLLREEPYGAKDAESDEQ